MKILFQGDSITDANRNRSNIHDLGQGYAKYAAPLIQKAMPDTEFEFIDLGISGNRSDDILARSTTDIVDIDPDVISILIGINDVWHEIHGKNGLELDRFERVYRMMIEDTKKVLPNVKFIICEPFVLKGEATEEWFEQFSEIRKYAAVIKNLAKEYGIPFVELQDKFDEAAEKHGAVHYLYDGVHPDIAGGKLIAEEWMKVFKANF